MQTTTTLTPGSTEWTRAITASKIPAILGISRYKSRYSLWHEMAGNIPPVQPSPSQAELFRYGHAAEVAGEAYARLRMPGWRLNRREVQYSRVLDGVPVYATIDRRASRGSARRAVEIKTARSLEEWGDDGTGTVPADYASQVLWQMYVTGWTKYPAAVVLWPQYGQPKLYLVEYDEIVVQSIIGEVVDWMDSLKRGVAPELDDTVSTYKTVRSLHPEIVPGEAEISVDTAENFSAAQRELADARRAAQLAKNLLAAQMGNKQTAVCCGERIAERRKNKSTVSLYPLKTELF